MSQKRVKRTISVITGTRAEFGMLRTIMRAVQRHPLLELQVIAAGAHLLPPHRTIEEVREEFPDAVGVEMQRTGDVGRFADAAALGRGIAGFAKVFAESHPDIVVTLGDRIEAFAAAAAASVAGVRVAHLHGGDRAEGIADEALRHAITKLAHIHLPATQKSALRIIAMGEDPQRVHIVGSPAMDGLGEIPPLNDREFAALCAPRILILLHPVGDEDGVEYQRASTLISISQTIASTLVLHPNHDSGRDGIMRAIDEAEGVHEADAADAHASTASTDASATSLGVERRLMTRAHFPREKFIALLRRANVLVGNSSAGLIECAAIPIRAINLGRRQSGRETPSNVIDIPEWNYQTIEDTIARAVAAPPLSRDDANHPYGDGCTGQRVADLLAKFDGAAHSLKKRNAY